MASFMGPEIAELRESLSAAGHGARVWLLAGVRAEVDFQVRGLREGFGAVGVGAEVAAGFIRGAGAGDRRSASGGWWR